MAWSIAVLVALVLAGTSSAAQLEPAVPNVEDAAATVQDEVATVLDEATSVLEEPNSPPPSVEPTPPPPEPDSSARERPATHAVSKRDAPDAPAPAVRERRLSAAKIEPRPRVTPPTRPAARPVDPGESVSAPVRELEQAALGHSSLADSAGAVGFRLFVATLLAAGLALLALAALPAPRGRPRPWTPVLLAERRTELVAVGVSLLAGLGMAVALLAP